jgi:uncharacterized cupredoxin-like copper-binding protein
MDTKHLRYPPRVAAVGVAAVIGLALTGCGGKNNNPSSAPATTTASPAPTAAATSGGGGQGTVVTVDEVDFKLNLSTTTFEPGTYTFVAKNTGQSTHALEIDGPGVADKKSDTIAPGASTMLTVTLQKGSYELYCPVDGHKALGMDTHITVG